MSDINVHAPATVVIHSWPRGFGAVELGFLLGAGAAIGVGTFLGAMSLLAMVLNWLAA